MNRSHVPMIALCGALLLSGGCASPRGGFGHPPSPPLAATPAGLPVSATQTLHAGFGGGEAVLLCAFAADAAGWKSACVSPAGQRVMTLSMDAQGKLAMETGPGVPPQLDPARIAGDIQLAMWPLALLQDAQRGSGWDTFTPTPATRRLQHDGRLVAEVHYAGDDPWNGTLWIANFRDGYSLQIETRTQTDGTP